MSTIHIKVIEHMHKKFETNRTKIKCDCHKDAEMSCSGYLFLLKEKYFPSENIVYDYIQCKYLIVTVYFMIEPSHSQTVNYVPVLEEKW